MTLATLITSANCLKLAAALRGSQPLVVLAILFVAWVLPGGLASGTRDLVERQSWVEQTLLVVPTRPLTELHLPFTMEAPASPKSGNTIRCEVAAVSAADPPHFGQFIANATAPTVRCTFSYQGNGWSRIKETRSGQTEFDFLAETFAQPGHPQGRMPAFTSSQAAYVKHSRVPAVWAEHVLCILAMLSFLFLWYRMITPVPAPVPPRWTVKEYVWVATLFAAPTLTMLAFLGMKVSIGLPYQPTGTWTAASLMSALVVAPIVEESFFRAWLIPALERTRAARWAVLLSTIVWALTHHHDVVQTASFYFSGLALGYLWLRRRSLVLCMLSHCLVNLVITLLRIYNPQS